MTLLQRSFQRAVVFLSDHCEVLTKAGAKNLQVALQTKTMQELPVSTFSRVFLESYTEQLSREQMEAIALWEKNLCEFSTADRAALSARFVRVQEFLAKFADEIVILQKPNLRSVVMSNQAHKHAEWAQAPNLFRRDYAFLTEEGICLLEDWELVLCDTSVAFLPRVETSVGNVADESVAFLPRPEQSLERVTDASVVFLPRLVRSFGRVKAFVAEHAQQLKLQQIFFW